jgi:diguanylate cyclase (GGDEF)-like protein/putative nucleotidyltransferase with HDIG domain
MRMADSRPAGWLDIKRREQVPQALARLAVITLFVVLWIFLWVVRAPMPVPFLLVLGLEAAFFFLYVRVVFLLPSAGAVQVAHYVMLTAEIIFHTTMVYFLGGLGWLGPFAYVFGLIFANAFLDPRRGFVYTVGVASAFVSLALLDASGAIPHYGYLEGRAYNDGRFLFTTVLGGVGVFVSIYAWMNWVGRQLRVERDTAMRSQQQLLEAQTAIRNQNVELEQRVRERTAELERTNAALRVSEALARATIESTADGILVVDREGKVAYANARFAALWRIPDTMLQTRDDDQMLGFVLDQLVDPEAFLAKVRELYASDREDFDTLLFKDGRVIERYSRPLISASAVEGRVWSFRDATERRRAEELLRKQASRDPLTDCLNHAAITSQMADLTSRDGARIAIVMADIDGMKAINDTYGHQVGDAALLAVAGALSRSGAIVGRYGGDEFIAVLPDVPRPDAQRYCGQVMEVLEQTTVPDAGTGSHVPVRASLGLAIYPDEASDVESAVRLADDAMYAEKRERRMQQDVIPQRASVGDERATRIIGEIVPLLTAPGRLDEKLRMVAHRLSASGGYDAVRFRLDQGSRRAADATYLTLSPEGVSSGPNGVPETADRMRAVLERTRRPIIISDLPRDDRVSPNEQQIFDAAGLHSAVIVPMIWHGDMVGVLSVASKRVGALDARDAQFVSTIADQVTAIIRMETLVDDLQAATGRLEDARTDTMVLLAAAAEAHEQSTGEHLHRVQALSERLARELGYDDADASAVGNAAILHDIGKIRVPERILQSPSRLDGTEWATMKQHTVWGAEFLAQRPGFEMAAVVAACHHERWDGGGYPRGLSGEQIPEIAQIVTVADSFDAITSDRPYRAARGADWAIEEIMRCAGTQFSPRVVDALRALYERGELTADGHAAEGSRDPRDEEPRAA